MIDDKRMNGLTEVPSAGAPATTDDDSEVKIVACGASQRGARKRRVVGAVENIEHGCD